MIPSILLMYGRYMLAYVSMLVYLKYEIMGGLKWLGWRSTQATIRLNQVYFFLVKFFKSLHYESKRFIFQCHIARKHSHPSLQSRGVKKTSFRERSQSLRRKDAEARSSKRGVINQVELCKDALLHRKCRVLRQVGAPCRWNQERRQSARRAVRWKKIFRDRKRSHPRTGYTFNFR